MPLCGIIIGKMNYFERARYFRTKKRLGQNFLIDGQVISDIIDYADIKPDDTVVEIGPGVGFVTEQLVKHAKHVFAIELDEEAVKELEKIDASNLTIIHKDILKTDLSKLCNEKIKIVANIPYYITSPIIAHLLGEIDASEDSGAVPRGQRLWAGEGPGKAPDLSRLSLFARNILYNPVLIRTAGPVPGRWGVYVPEKHSPVKVPAGKIPETGTMEIIFRPAAFEKQETLLNCGNFSLTLTEENDGRKIIVSGKNSLPVGKNRETWRKLTLTLQKNTALLSLDQSSPQHLSQRPGTGEIVFVNVGRNPIFDVLISCGKISSGNK